MQYNTETFPIIEQYQKKGMKVFEIDGEKDPETVYNNCIGLISSYLK